MKKHPKVDKKPVVLLLGFLPPPYIGPAIATEIILNSRLNDRFRLVHLNTNTHKSIDTVNRFRFSPFFLNFIIYLKMAMRIIRHRPALVLIPVSQTTAGFVKDSVFILISRWFLRKTLLQLRGSNFRNWIDGCGAFIRFYVRFVLRQTQGMIVLGEKLKRIFDGYYRAERIFVVPNGGDFAIPPSGEKEESVKLLYLGNMQPQKGIEDVLLGMKALAGLQVRQPHDLDVVGSFRDTKTRDLCYSLLREESLPVFFHPPVSGNEKLEYLARADIFVFTPREPEGFPWVIVEAMAAGLPIVTTDQGAIGEAVIDGVNGYIVASHSPVQIAEKMKILIEEEPRRKEMGRRSRALYEEKFTEGKMVENFSRVFGSLIEKPCVE